MFSESAPAKINLALHVTGRRPDHYHDLESLVVFADLSDANFPADATAHTLRAAAPHARLVGFASHVDLKSLASARAAGFDLTLSRSEFTAQLPSLIKS